MSPVSYTHLTLSAEIYDNDPLISQNALKEIYFNGSLISQRFLSVKLHSLAFNVKIKELCTHFLYTSSHLKNLGHFYRVQLIFQFHYNVFVTSVIEFYVTNYFLSHLQ